MTAESLNEATASPEHNLGRVRAGCVGNMMLHTVTVRCTLEFAAGSRKVPDVQKITAFFYMPPTVNRQNFLFWKANREPQAHR
jgi:hypothetical protein